MTRPGQTPPTDVDVCLGKAAALMLRDMSGFVVWVEADATVRRTVIANPATVGSGSWRDAFDTGHAICLAIEARHAAENALSALDALTESHR